MDKLISKNLVVNRRRFSVIPAGHDDFWNKLQSGSWEAETFRVFEQYISSNTCFLDIGGWIGPTVLYGAQLAKSTLVFEPDPIAFKSLCRNISVNKNKEWARNITVVNEAVARNAGKRLMGSRKKGGDSMSSFFISAGKTSWQVTTTTFEELLLKYQLEDEELFIKIDVEGGEYELLPAINKLLENHKATIYLSLHPHLKFADQKGSRVDRTSIINRLKLAWYQLKILLGLKCSSKLLVNREKMSLFKELCSIINTGDFSREIIISSL